MSEKRYVFVVQNYSGFVRIERRVWVSETARSVTVTSHFISDGQTFSREHVFDDEAAAVAYYWQVEEKRAATLRKHLKALEKRIAERKTPRVVKGGY